MMFSCKLFSALIIIFIHCEKNSQTIKYVLVQHSTVALFSVELAKCSLAGILVIKAGKKKTPTEVKQTKYNQRSEKTAVEQINPCVSPMMYKWKILCDELLQKPGHKQEGLSPCHMLFACLMVGLGEPHSFLTCCSDFNYSFVIPGLNTFFFSTMHSVFSKLNFDPAHYSQWIYSPLDSMILVWMGSSQTFTWLQSFSR